MSNLDTDPTELRPKRSSLDLMTEAIDESLAKHEEILGQMAGDIGALVSSSTRGERLLEDIAELLRGERSERLLLDERVGKLEARLSNGSG